MEMPEAYSSVLNLAQAMNVEEINKLDGCWEVELSPGGFFFSMNGHIETIRNRHDIEVEPFTFVIHFDDMPVGIIGPTGGTCMKGAEDDFIDAVNDLIEQLNNIGE